MLKYLFILSTFASILSCSNSSQKPGTENMEAEMKSAAMAAPEQFKPEMVVNKTDFACGMPVSAGISDTAQYEGKAYGFCSSECKAEFQKAPSEYLAKQQ